MAESRPESNSNGISTSQKLRLIFIVTLAMAFAYVITQYDLRAALNRSQSWIEAKGALAPLFFIGIYVLATVAMLPASALTVAAGILFGWLWGFVYVMVGASLGLACAFLVARYLARDLVSKWISSKKSFQKLDGMVKDQGPIIVAITRLVPIFPFNLLNYMFGLTRIGFITYLKWSVLCIAPGTMLYVAGVDAIKTAFVEQRVPWVLIGILALVVVIVASLVRFAKQRLRKTGPSS